MTEPTPTTPPKTNAKASVPAAPKHGRKSKRGPLIFALVVMLIGAWLLLEAFGVSVPSFSKIWPVFLGVGGLASLLDYLTISRRARSLGQAVFGLLSAGVGFVFSTGNAGWGEVLDWLPALPIIIGLAMLTTWAAAGRKDTGLFTAALVVIAVGFLGYFSRFDFLRDLLPSAQIVWAVSLLLVGALVTWRVFNKPTD